MTHVCQAAFVSDSPSSLLNIRVHVVSLSRPPTVDHSHKSSSTSEQLAV